MPSENIAQETVSGPLSPEDQSAPALSNLEVEPIQQQPAYPPPPSFYQQQLDKEGLQSGSNTLPPPAQIPPAGSYYPHAGTQWQNGIPTGPYSQPQPMPGYPIYQQGGSYPGMPTPYMPPAPGQPKGSKKWIVLLVSVLLVVVIASCSLCVWAGTTFFGGVYSQASDLVLGTRTLVDNYYGALQNQQYSEAYTYIHPEGSINGLTQAQFVQQAQQADKQYGPVLSYTSNPPTYHTNGTQFTDVMIVVNVGRKNKQYTVNLSVQKINNQWMITDYNQL